MTYFITKSDREYKYNIDCLKRELHKIVKRRKEYLKQNKGSEDADFLTLLLTSEEYKHDEDNIVEQCIVFLAAGTSTLTITICNMI